MVDGTHVVELCSICAIVTFICCWLLHGLWPFIWLSLRGYPWWPSSSTYWGSVCQPAPHWVWHRFFCWSDCMYITLLISAQCMLDHIWTIHALCLHISYCHTPTICSQTFITQHVCYLYFTPSSCFSYRHVSYLVLRHLITFVDLNFGQCFFFPSSNTLFNSVMI